MTDLTMHHVNMSVEGDSLTLEQDIGCGETHTIYLHMDQFRIIAERLGLLGRLPIVWRQPFLIDTIEGDQHGKY